MLVKSIKRTLLQMTASSCASSSHVRDRACQPPIPTLACVEPHLIHYEHTAGSPALESIRPGCSPDEGCQIPICPANARKGMDGGTAQGARCKRCGGRHEGAARRQGPHQVPQHQRLACACSASPGLILHLLCAIDGLPYACSQACRLHAVCAHARKENGTVQNCCRA